VALALQDHAVQLVEGGQGRGVYTHPFWGLHCTEKHGFGGQVRGAMEQQLDAALTAAVLHISGGTQSVGLIQLPQEQIPQQPTQVESSTSQAVDEILWTKVDKSCQD